MPIAPLNDWLYIDPSQLRHKAELQSQVAASGSFGAAPAWTTIARPWCSVNVVSAREVSAVDQMTSQVSHIIVMRYPTYTVAPAMRFLINGETYLVQNVVDVQARRVMLKVFALVINEAA